MRVFSTIIALLILAAAGVAQAGHRVEAFTGHAYDLRSGHEHGAQCRHGRHQLRGPGCHEVLEWVRGPYGNSLRVARTVCRDRYGRPYVVPGTAHVVRRRH